MLFITLLSSLPFKQTTSSTILQLDQVSNTSSAFAAYFANFRYGQLLLQILKVDVLTFITTEGALRLLTTYDNHSSNPIPFHPSDSIRLNSVRGKTNSRKPIFGKGCWNLSIKSGDLVGRCIVAAHFRGRIRNKNQAWWHLSLQIRGIQGSTSLKVTFQLL